MRRLGAFGLAILVAIGLFWMMHALVYLSGGAIAKREDLGGIDFVRLKRQESLQERERRKPEKPPPPKKPPPPPKLKSVQTPKPQQQPQQMNLPNLNLPTNIGGGPFLGTYSATPTSGSSQAVPLVRIQPQYPRRAARAGTEGYVTMSLVINPDGTVRDAKVTDAQPRGVFERSAIAAILKWKFKPRVIDGQPVEQSATQTLNFTLN